MSGMAPQHGRLDGIEMVLERLLLQLKPLEREHYRNQPLALIARDAAFHMGLRVLDIISARRHAPYVRARCAIAWAASEALGDSLPKIGIALGRRDHTTILHGLRRAGQLRDADPAFRLLTDRLVRDALARQARS